MNGRKAWSFSCEEKLATVEAIKKEGLTASCLAGILGISNQTIANWRKMYEEKGRDGLKSKISSRAKARRKPLAVREKILEYKKQNPQAGARQVAAGLERFHFLKVCAQTVRNVLKAGNKEGADIPAVKRVKPNPPKKRRYTRFERSLPNQLWQMDIFTWMLRGVHRVYIIAAIDDCSRFIVGWGLFRVQSGDNVLEVLKGAIEKYGFPEEILTDNGKQFYSWRGKAKFEKTVVRMGIKHIRSRPHHPQTLGKIEAFWKNIWRELLGEYPLSTFEEAQKAISAWIQKYNFKRPHQGLSAGGRKITPADKYYKAEKVITKAVDEGIKETEEFLKNNPSAVPSPVYLAGKIGGRDILIRAKEGDISIQGLDAGAVLSQPGNDHTPEPCKKEENVIQLSASDDGVKIDTQQEGTKDEHPGQGADNVRESNADSGGIGQKDPDNQVVPGSPDNTKAVLQPAKAGDDRAGRSDAGCTPGQAPEGQSPGPLTGPADDTKPQAGEQEQR